MDVEKTTITKMNAINWYRL